MTARIIQKIRRRSTSDLFGAAAICVVLVSGRSVQTVHCFSHTVFRVKTVRCRAIIGRVARRVVRDAASRNDLIIGIKSVIGCWAVSRRHVLLPAISKAVIDVAEDVLAAVLI